MKKIIYITNLVGTYHILIRVMMKVSMTIFSLLIITHSINSQTGAVTNHADSTLVSYTSAGGNDTVAGLNIIDSGHFRLPVDTQTVETSNKIFTIYNYEDGMVIDRLDLRTGETKRILDIGGIENKPVCEDKKFRGHWSGIEVGLNNFMYDGFTFKTPAEYDYMDLKWIGSWNFSFNFAQLSIPFGKKAGLVTGAGYEINHYRFMHDNSVQLNDSTGNIEEWPLDGVFDVKKSKLTTGYLNVPLLLEMQIPKPGSRQMSYCSFGIIWGFNVHSAIKIKHYVNDQKQKYVERNSDLNIDNIRTGITFRCGSRDKDNSSSGMYATYYFSGLFENDKGPLLYPVEAGFRIDF